MPLNKRIYSCTCGWKVSRDTNAALNIKKQGIEKLKAARYTPDHNDMIWYPSRLVRLHLKLWPMKREASFFRWRRYHRVIARSWCRSFY
ncbi:hypothetical protein H0X48_04125 [Candidatus Dependentiae bacterium]|nr:hypothetical protein [Candidatus Dependentiae bacterium]